ncbi:MAG: hypothetical protein ACFFEM_13910 [Candidatus Thorarchaeota archaeon]
MGIEISRRVVGLIVGILLIVSVSSPFIFFSHYPDYDNVIELTLKYSHQEANYSSDDGWNTLVDETIVRTYFTSLNNMSRILSNETIAGYPLITDVSDWRIGFSVNIRGHTGYVDSDMQDSGHNCWIVSIDDYNSVYYDKDWGLLVEKRYSRVVYFGSVFDIEREIIEYTLTDSNLEDFGSYYISLDGWLFSGILVQIVVVIGFVYDRRFGEV